jgi:hypothetical protein
MTALRTLMRGIVDYAGLFPPAQLAMAPAAANYAAYRAGPRAWALGRFVVPAARLDEFASAAGALLPRDGDVWRLAALGGGDLPADLERITAFNQRCAGSALVDTLEIKAGSPAAIAAAAQAMPDQLTLYVELPTAADPGELVAALAHVGARAKMRTGGVTADAFPTPTELLRFIQACVAANVPFKATAGLHHPLRAAYPLTYAPDSPTGTMYGFLNVFLAAAMLYTGVVPAEAAPLLVEGELSAFDFDANGISWHGQRLAHHDLAHTREHIAIAFGSCSFEEPLDDLEGLSPIPFE